MRYFVLPYISASRSAKTMAEALPEGKRIRLEGSSYRPQAGDLIINWGKLRAADHLPPLPDGVKLLNHDTRITDKLAFFTALERAGRGDIIPKFWTNKRNIPADAYPIFCRTSTGGHAGAGIEIADTPAGLVDAPLYTSFVDNTAEYRVHVGKLPDGRTEIIGIQQKKHRNDLPWGDTRVKHIQNGFIYVHGGVVAPPYIYDAARKGLRATNLDFGAFDIIDDTRNGRACILEVNTAPDIEGVDIQGYARFFTSLVADNALERAAAPAEPVRQAVEPPHPNDQPLHLRPGYAEAVEEVLQVVEPVPAPAPARVAPAPSPVLARAAEAGGNRRFAVVMGVSVAAREIMATVEAASLEDALRQVRQNPNAYLGEVQPVIDVTSVSVER